MRPRYRIPHKVFEGLRYTDFLGPGPTYVPACNSRSRFHPTAIVRTHDFRQDRSVKGKYVKPFNLFSGSFYLRRFFAQMAREKGIS